MLGVDNDNDVWIMHCILRAIHEAGIQKRMDCRGGGTKEAEVRRAKLGGS